MFLYRNIEYITFQNIQITGLNACLSIKNLGLYMAQTSYKKLRTRHPKVQLTHFSFAVSCLSRMCMELFF